MDLRPLAGGRGGRGAARGGLRLARGGAAPAAAAGAEAKGFGRELWGGFELHRGRARGAQRHGHGGVFGVAGDGQGECAEESRQGATAAVGFVGGSAPEVAGAWGQRVRPLLFGSVMDEFEATGGAAWPDFSAEVAFTGGAASQGQRELSANGWLPTPCFHRKDQRGPFRAPGTCCTPVCRVHQGTSRRRGTVHHKTAIKKQVPKQGYSTIVPL